VRKAGENLDFDPKEKLNHIEEYSPLLKLAYELSNFLLAIFDKDISKPEARKEINDWMRRVLRSRVSCFDTFLSTKEKIQKPNFAT